MSSCLGLVPPKVDRATPHQSPVKTVPHRHSHRPIWWRRFLNWCSPFSGDSVCIIDNNKTNQRKSWGCFPPSSNFCGKLACLSFFIYFCLVIFCFVFEILLPLPPQCYDFAGLHLYLLSFIHSVSVLFFLLDIRPYNIRDVNIYVRLLNITVWLHNIHVRILNICVKST